MMTKPFIAAAVHVDGASLVVPRQFATQLRRADEFIKLAVAAASKALDMYQGWQNLAEGSGLFVGTAFGPMQTNFDVLGLIADENQTSPTLFSHSVFNSAAGYLARLLSIQGSSQTFTDFSYPFLQALAAGAGAISSGRLKQCMVVQVETYSDLLIDARQRTGQSASTWETGAVCWLLTSQDEGGWRIDDISINHSPAAATEYLHRKEYLNINRDNIPCPTPLSAAKTVADLLTRKNVDTGIAFTITAPYGSVGLKLQHN